MDKTKLLSQIPMFSGLHSSCIKTLSDVAKEINVDKGKQVFAQGDPGDAFYIISSGAVRVLKKGSEGYDEVARMSAGEGFGEMALIEDERRSATVEAAEPTHLLQIKRSDLERLLAVDHALAMDTYKAWTKYLSQRLRSTTQTLASTMDSTKQLRKFNYFPETW